MWIPQKNENCQGQTDHQPPPPPGPQKAHHRLTFPKSSRILSKDHYYKVIKGGGKWRGEWLIIDYRLGKAQCPKLGMTVSRKHGKAHARNRFKRVVREAFREAYPQMPLTLEMNVLPRAPIVYPSKRQIAEDLARFLTKIKVIA